MIDTHAHLQFSELYTTIDVIIERAKANGVEGVIVPSTSLKNSITTVEVTNKNSFMRAAIGVHPTEVLNFDLIQIESFKDIILKNKVIAIGEVGLDYYHSKEHIKTQHKVFELMISLAQENLLPLIIHSREAFEDCYQILLSNGKNYPVVIHSFTEGLDHALKWLEMGYFLSFNGIITYPKNHELREVVSRVPLESILLETDSPYLAPQSKRGKLCEPSFLPEIAQMIADIKNISIAEVDEVTTQNARKLFNLDL